MIFDILHCALLMAEKAVKVMKQREMEEDPIQPITEAVILENSVRAVLFSAEFRRINK